MKEKCLVLIEFSLLFSTFAHRFFIPTRLNIVYARKDYYS